MCIDFAHIILKKILQQGCKHPPDAVKPWSNQSAQKLKERSRIAKLSSVVVASVRTLYYIAFPCLTFASRRHRLIPILDSFGQKIKFVCGNQARWNLFLAYIAEQISR